MHIPKNQLTAYWDHPQHGLIEVRLANPYKTKGFWLKVTAVIAVVVGTVLASWGLADGWHYAVVTKTLDASSGGVTRTIDVLDTVAADDLPGFWLGVFIGLIVLVVVIAMAVGIGSLIAWIKKWYYGLLAAIALVALGTVLDVTGVTVHRPFVVGALTALVVLVGVGVVIMIMGTAVWRPEWQYLNNVAPAAAQPAPPPAPMTIPPPPPPNFGGPGAVTAP